MGIVGQLKQISGLTLEYFRKDSSLVDLFLTAKWLPESAFWQSTDYRDEKTKQEAQQKFEKQKLSNEDKRRLIALFLAEWETPELDLHKSWSELTFLLAGYIPVYVDSGYTIPELRNENNPKPRNVWSKIFQPCKYYENQTFLPFLVKFNSEWDGLPLVNAIGAGKEIGYRTDYGTIRYRLPDQVEQILDGLTHLRETGLQNRFYQESEKANPCPLIDWSEEEMLEWMTDYYREIHAYYQDAATQGKAMLLYLT